jgi:hypothetical protein
MNTRNEEADPSQIGSRTTQPLDHSPSPGEVELNRVAKVYDLKPALARKKFADNVLRAWGMGGAA